MISTLIQKILITVVFAGFIMSVGAQSAQAADIEAMVSQDWRVALPAELPEPAQEMASLEVGVNQ